MRKGLVLALVLVIAAAGLLSACKTGKPEETTASTAAGGVSLTAAPTTASPTTAGTIAATTTTAAPQQPVNIKYATTFSSSSQGGKTVQHFCDYVTEKTAGAITFEINFGGILGNSQDELGLVSTGEVEMVSLHHTAYAEQLPLVNFPSTAPPDAKTALAYFDYLVFQNDDTAALIHAEAAGQNILYLGFVARGGNVFAAKDPFTGLSDLVGRKFGASSALAAFKALNYTVVEAAPADAKKNFAAGTIGATLMPFYTVIQQKCYEVAKNYRWDGTYAAGDVFTINLDAWYKLTPATQQIMRDAAKDAEQYSLDLAAENTKSQLETVSAAGATVGSLSAVDQATWWKTLFASNAADCTTRAERLGVADKMATVLEAAAGFTKVDWTPAQK